VALLFLNAAGQVSAQLSPALLGTVLIGLQQLKQSIETSITTVDAETAQKLNQLGLLGDSAIRQIHGVIDDVSNKVTVNEVKLFTDIFTVMSTVNSELDKKGYLAYVGINSTLANLATILHGIPFVDIPTFMYATYPLRLSPHASDRTVLFYGYFPDVDDAHPATVKYAAAGLPVQIAPLKRYIGGSLVIQVEPQYLREEQFIEFSILIPEKWWHFFHKTRTFNARVYVEKLNALSIKIDTFQENPNLWASLPSASEHHERADSSRTSNVGSASAQQLFSTLINNSTDYVASTATFTAMPNRVEAVDSPCWCNCNGSSASLRSWDANTVDWQLLAPTCGPQVCTRGGHLIPETQVCGGGGTHADIYLKPSFRVKRQNQPSDVLLNSQSIMMKRRDVWQGQALPVQWDNISLVGVFTDGDETHTCHTKVSKQVPKGTCELLDGAVENNVLIIQTR